MAMPGYLVDEAAGLGASAVNTGQDGGGFNPLSRIQEMMSGPAKLKGAAGVSAGLFVQWLLGKLMEGYAIHSQQATERKAIEAQAQMTTPESLYYQAALPQAQAAEAQAQQALTAQLTGGIIGPSLARGERLIGG
jgi:hypothetical protein